MRRLRNGGKEIRFPRFRTCYWLKINVWRSCSPHLTLKVNWFVVSVGSLDNGIDMGSCSWMLNDPNLTTKRWYVFNIRWQHNLRNITGITIYVTHLLLGSHVMNLFMSPRNQWVSNISTLISGVWSWIRDSVEITMKWNVFKSELLTIISDNLCLWLYISIFQAPSSLTERFSADLFRTLKQKTKTKKKTAHAHIHFDINVNIYIYICIVLYILICIYIYTC